MTLFFDILLLVLGIAGVYFGAHWLVDGASSVSRKLNISPLVIGLTVVAFGTSAPELTVSVISSANGNAGIAIGNAVGSNIINILIILGISSLIYPLALNKITIWRDIPMSLVATLVLFFMINDRWLDGSAENVISRTDSIALLFFFAIFLYYTFSGAKGHKPDASVKIKIHSWWLSVILILGGLAGLVLGGRFIVEAATAMAKAAGMSDEMIGLTIVAFGTSIPELATSVVAAFKKHHDIAVGNIVGSNVFNIFLILGVSGLVNPLKVAPGTNIELYILMAATVFLFLSAFTLKKKKIDRLEGAFFVFFYLIFLTYLIIKEV